MDGLMMDYQLNVPALLRRADELYGDERDREPTSRQELASLHVRRLRLPDEEAGRRATQARARGRRPRRHVHVEPLAAPRDVHGLAGRRLRHAHAEPPPPSRRQHVHRHPRRRSRAHRRQDPLAARGAVRAAVRLRARRRGRRRRDARRGDRLRGPHRGRRRVGVLVPRHPRERPRPRCVTRAAPRAARRASSTRTARSRSTR